MGEGIPHFLLPRMGKHYLYEFANGKEYMPDQAPRSPLFVFSWDPLPRSLIFLLTFVILVLVFYYDLASGETQYSSVGIEAALSFLLMVYTLVLSVKPWLYPVRKARFFEDHAELEGRKVGSTIMYTDIVGLEEVNGFGFLEPMRQVHITLDGREEPIRIFGNPRNRELDTTLYAWLWHKTERQLSKKIYLSES